MDRREGAERQRRIDGLFIEKGFNVGRLARCLRGRQRRRGRVGEHGAVCTGLDQIVVTNVTAYVGYCLGIAVIIALTPLTAIIAYAIGCATLVAAMLTFQHSAGARLSSLPNCATLTVNIAG